MYEANIGAVLKHLFDSCHHPRKGDAFLMVTIAKYKGIRFWVVF